MRPKWRLCGVDRLERRESWSPSSSRSASSRGSDVEMRGVIEGHVKDWEGQQVSPRLMRRPSE